MARNTHSPCSCYSCANTRADRHWPCPPGALEDGAGNGTSDDAVGGIVLAADGADDAVGAIVNQSNDTSAVAQERSTSCDGVQDTVHAQPPWHRGWVLLQALRETPRASNGESSQIADTSAITEVVRPAATGECGVID